MILMATCTLGLEGALSRELKSMGYKIMDSLSGKVLFEGDIEDIPRLNIWLRTAERLIIVLGIGRVETFDELFDFVESLEWEEFIEKGGKFPVVKVKSVRSKLFSERTIQRVVKRAVASRLERFHGTTFEKGALYPIHVYLRNDELIIGIDTTGFEGLHKRGYRLKYSKAPLRETIAASMLVLSRYDGSSPLLDPFCGSGTIAIEAGLIAKNIAPGLIRNFVSESWKIVRGWKRIRKEAIGSIVESKSLIVCSDVDEKILKVAEENAKRASVDIDFIVSDFRDLKLDLGFGKIVTNPPYGKRLNFNLRDLKVLFDRFNGWEIHVLSPVSLDKIVGKRAKKKTAFFNSGIKVIFHQYF